MRRDSTNPLHPGWQSNNPIVLWFVWLILMRFRRPERPAGPVLVISSTSKMFFGALTFFKVLEWIAVNNNESVQYWIRSDLYVKGFWSATCRHYIGNTERITSLQCVRIEVLFFTLLLPVSEAKTLQNPYKMLKTLWPKGKGWKFISAPQNFITKPVRSTKKLAKKRF